MRLELPINLMLTFLASFLLAGGPAKGEEHVLTFDDLDEDDSFLSNRQPYGHLGITFDGTGENGGSVPRVLTPATGTHSGTQALVNDYAYASEFGSWGQELIVELDFSADRVSLYAGLTDDVLEPTVVRLEGYRVWDGYPVGEPLAWDEVELGSSAVSPAVARQLSLDVPGGGIQFIIISNGLTGARELIDTMTIRSSDDPLPPVEDTEIPWVVITNPSFGASTTRLRVPVMGTVTDDTALESMSAMVDGETFPLPVGGTTSPYYFGGFVTLDNSDGEHTITVTATDIFGHTGSAVRSVELAYEAAHLPPEPPPPNLNFEARGMEVTQSIQGWDMIGETPRDIDNQTLLVAGKKTLVRVYAEVLGVDDPVAGVRCSLTASIGTETLEGSPIYSSNEVTLVPGEDYLDQRPHQVKSFNFILPTEWTTQGGISLRATVNPGNYLTERPGAFDAYNDAILDVMFHDTDEVCISIYRIESTNEGGLFPSVNDVATNVNLLQRTYPVAADRFSMVLAGRWPTDRVLEDDKDLSRLLRDFRRSFGFYYGRAYALPCTHTVYLGLTHPTIEHRGVTHSSFPVSLSVANDSDFYRVKTAHEVGHAVGLGHVEGCDDPADPYENYPFYPDPVFAHTWYSEASIGEWGVELLDDDTFVLMDPADMRDIMSYCGDRWMSVHTWRRLTSIFGARAPAAELHLEPALELGIGGREAPYFLVNGAVSAGGGAELDPTWTVVLPAGSSDHTGRGTHSIRLLGANDRLLFERQFTPSPLRDLEGHALIDELMPAIDGVTKIVLEDGLLGRQIRAGTRAPTVQINYPSGGEEWPATGYQQIAWVGGDPDQDPVTFAAFYSADNGKTWHALATDIPNAGMGVRLEDLPGGKECLLRVAVSDGIHQGDRISGKFSKMGQPPQVKILAPEPVRSFAYGQPVVFEGFASDIDDRKLQPEDLSWSSDRDGPIGTGSVVGSTSLSPGLHVVTFEAQDSDGMIGMDEVGVYVEDPEWTTATSVFLPRTGQETCYTPAGVETRCSGTGQDGEIRAGVVWPDPRFTDNGDGTVTDRLTGLVWAADAGTPGVRQCPPGPMRWESAMDYIACLNDSSYLGHRDWRLANVNELLSLVNYATWDLPRRWFQGLGFLNPQNAAYWTSTSYAPNRENSWYVDMRTGAHGHHSKATEHFVWPVRGPLAEGDRIPAQLWRTGQTRASWDRDDGSLKRGVVWPSPRFTDHGNGTITDNLTGLMWLQDAGCLEPSSWPEALAAIARFNEDPEDLACLGYGASYRDWRLPNNKEYQSLISFGHQDPALPSDQLFHDPQHDVVSFWSSTTSADRPDRAWAVDFREGSFSSALKVGPNLGVLAVRGDGSRGAAPGAGSHLTLSLADDFDPVSVGGLVTYTAAVTNLGPAEATDVVLTNLCPPGAEFVSVSCAGGDYDPAEDLATCELGALAHGDVAQVEIVLRAPARPGSMRDVAEVSCGSGDPYAADNRASETTSVSEQEHVRLRLIKEGDGDGSVRSGGREIDCGAICQASLPRGTLITLEAKASDGSSFEGWSGGGCTGVGGCNLALGEDTTVVAKFALLSTEPSFQRGNADADEQFNITDAVYVLSYLFLGGPEPPCHKAADTDDNGGLEITDAVGILGYLFLGGPAPRDPFDSCGPDPTPDGLSCVSFPPCS